jgi:tetratricopeptide (TPR) repeat protein
VVLLLVSSDFLASDYCYDRELTRALERHAQGAARVVPVIVRACDWQSSVIRRLQAVPRDNQPVEGHPDGVDAALTQVSVALRGVAAELWVQRAGPDTRPPSRDSWARDVASAATPAPALPGDSGATPSLSAAGQPAVEDRGQGRTIKIAALKLWPFEVGPFEMVWPPRLGLKRAGAAVVALLLATGIATALVYGLKIKPVTEAARDAMRRGDYAAAVSALKTLNPKLQWWPGLSRALDQAEFGAQLSTSDIRDLAPALYTLRTQYPNEVDVLMFQGLSAFYDQQDGNLDRAIGFFTQAADRDPKHVQAHVLAAGRRADRAYAELLRGAEVQARGDVVEALRLLDRLEERVGFAKDLPQVASQRAELLELQGDVSRAYDTYARLPSADILSALQAAMISWRLASQDSRSARGVEKAESALTRLEDRGASEEDSEGWLFRVRETDFIRVRDRIDKICLASRTVEISRTLTAATEQNAREVTTALRQGQPEPCPRRAQIEMINEVLCVQVAAALAVVPVSDAARRTVLQAWRADRLHCAADLKAPPQLRGSGITAKTSGEFRSSGEGAHT